jgi:hypothetical protein
MTLNLYFNFFFFFKKKLTHNLCYKSIGEQTSFVTSPPNSTSGIPSDLLLFEKELDRHIEEEILYDKATDTQA